MKTRHPSRIRRAGAAVALTTMTLTGVAAAAVLSPTVAAAKDAEGADPCAAMEGWDWVICELEELFGFPHGDGGGTGGGAPGGGGGTGTPGGGTGGTGGDGGSDLGTLDFVVVTEEDSGLEMWMPIKNGQPVTEGIEAFRPTQRPTNSKPPKPHKKTVGSRYSIAIVRVPIRPASTPAADRPTTGTPMPTTTIVRPAR